MYFIAMFPKHTTQVERSILCQAQVAWGFTIQLWTPGVVYLACLRAHGDLSLAYDPLNKVVLVIGSSGGSYGFIISLVGGRNSHQPDN